MVNSLLSIKILEIEDPEKNKSEILNFLECHYEGAKTQKEEMAIKLGLKIFKLQASNMDYVNCIKILEEILRILHKEMLFGRSHKNIVEQYLYVSGLLAYYNVLIGNFKEVQRFSKKIKKSVLIISDVNVKSTSLSSNQYRWEDTLVPKYEFFQSILESIADQELGKKDSNDRGSIEMLKKSFSKLNLNESFKDSENLILNAMIMDQDREFTDSIERQYNSNMTNFSRILENKNKRIDDNQILGFYFYLYNNMLELYSDFQKGSSRKNQILNKLKTNSINLIYFTSELTPMNTHLQNLFRANYFKQMFNRLFFFHIFCFYSENNFKKVIELYDEYNSVYKVQFELTPDKGFFSIKKLKADSLFKLRRFREAITEYNQLIGNVKDKGTVYFNLAISHMFLKENSNAKEYFELASEEFKNDPEKIRLIKSLKP